MLNKTPENVQMVLKNAAQRLISSTWQPPLISDAIICGTLTPYESRSDVYCLLRVAECRLTRRGYNYDDMDGRCLL